ncbi:MAG: CpaE family protein [Acidobacteriota bacterium]
MLADKKTGKRFRTMSGRTLNCVLIALETSPIHMIREVIGNSFALQLTRWQREYSDEQALLKTLRLGTPDLLLVDFADSGRAQKIVQIAQGHFPGTEIVALCEENVSTLSALLKFGIRHYLTPSHKLEEVNEILNGLAEQLSRRPAVASTGGNIVSFLPAKPGSGASTIVANTAFLTSRSGMKRTLLADFDNNAGVQSFLFKLKPEHTLQDALNAVQDLDGDIWSRLCSQVETLEVLPVDREGSRNAETAQVTRLLQFFRQMYDLTLVDLSGQLDPFAMETLLESKLVYLVCTQELACQHLLLRKVERLRRCGLDHQMKLIINRYLPKHVLTPERISEMVGLPVEIAIENNYELANCAGENGSQVKADSNLGRSYRKLAEILSENRVVAASPKRTLLDYLTQRFQRTSTQST